MCDSNICIVHDVLSETEPKDAGSEKSSGVVRLNTIRQIIEQVWYTENWQVFFFFFEIFHKLMLPHFFSGPSRSSRCDS